MRKIWVLMVLAGCASYPQVNWPPGAAGPAPALLPVQDLLGDEAQTGDAAGAALAAQAAALKARVADGG